MQTIKQPRFFILHQESGLTSHQAAQEAGLLATEYLAEIDCAAEAEVIEHLLASFSRLTGKTWILTEAATNMTRRDATV